MIPLGQQFVRGYYLVSGQGDIYCFGDVDFYGTVKEVFSKSTDIVTAFGGSNEIKLVGRNGTIYVLGAHAEKRMIDDANNVVDATHLDGTIHMLSPNGNLISETGDTFQFPYHEHDFVACAASSDGRGIYALDNSGRVHTRDAAHYGDISTIDVENVHIVDIAASPWGNGYWLLDNIGGVFCFGDVDYFGSVPGDSHTCSATKIVPSPTGYGYWIIDVRGMALPFGDALYCGHLAPGELTGTLVDMAVVADYDRRDRSWMFTTLVDNDIAALLGQQVQEYSEPLAE